MTEQNENQDDALGAGGIKALEAERKARRDAEKSLREAESRIAELERADLVREVATAKGIDGKLSERLRGSTREELEADADALLELVAPEKPTGIKPGGLPREALRGGGDPTVDAPESAEKMADRILGVNV